MHPDWIQHPLLHYALLAGGFGICLYLFLSLKAEMRRLQVHRWTHQQGTDAALEKWKTELESKLGEMSSQIREKTMPESAPAAVAGFNLTKRSQALQMHRRGATADQIAAALGLAPNEIELLLKVQRIVISRL